MNFLKDVWESFRGFFLAEVTNRLSVIVLATLVSLLFYVFTIKDFYYYIESSVLKQQEKILTQPDTIRATDIALFNTFCQKTSFDIYMSMRPLENNLRVKKVCGQISDMYKISIGA